MSQERQDNPIPVGSIWREKGNNRLIKITQSSDFPHWTYIDERGNPEPHGLEPANGFVYDTWFDHHCDAYDFLVWDRFTRVS